MGDELNIIGIIVKPLFLRVDITLHFFSSSSGVNNTILLLYDKLIASSNKNFSRGTFPLASKPVSRFNKGIKLLMALALKYGCLLDESI